MRRLGASLTLWMLYIVFFAVVVGRAESKIEAGLLGGVGFTVLVLTRFAIDRLLPLPFDLDAAPGSVTFAFRDLSLGYEFRALNPAAREAGGLTRA